MKRRVMFCQAYTPLVIILYDKIPKMISENKKKSLVSKYFFITLHPNRF